MKSVIITNIPTPYRIPVWKELNKNISLTVKCIAKSESNRSWNIKSENFIHSLKSFHFYFHKLDWGFHFTVPMSLFFSLIGENPKVIVITGYDNYQYWEALLYAKIFRKKTVFWNGSTLLSSRSENKIIKAIKKFFINRFDSYYTYGSKASEYLVSFGVDEKDIVTGTNTVDSDFYKLNTSNKTESIIKKFLYVGQLLERKGLENTIEAFRRIESKEWKLTIVGTGPDEQKLKQLVKEQNLSDQVIFVGYKQKEEILEYFSESNIMLMPSYSEVWGLVLNEGLASGLFCLSSKYAGATFDLISENENGLIIDPLDIDDIAQKIEKSMSMIFSKEKIKDTLKVSPITEASKIILAIHKALK